MDRGSVLTASPHTTQLLEPYPNMRFRDGMWLFREEFKVEFAEEVHKVDHGPNDSLSLLCPTRRILARGNTLNQPTVTIVGITLPSLLLAVLTPNRILNPPLTMSSQSLPVIGKAHAIWARITHCTPMANPS
jgi:hypothetical protein